MESTIEKLSLEIAEAVKLIMDPFTPSADRRRAHEMLDNFKDTSPMGAKCGFYLSNHNLAIVRHCGLQLIDSFIKLHWNEITQPQKLEIKNSILNYIASGTKPILEEEVYIKDAISRIVVELIKREWPQHWPSLMEEMHTLCVMGDVQTELVLLIFSRLADDIVQFQNVPDIRRREIYKTLCLHLSDLFSFFWKTLSMKTELYIANRNSGVAAELNLQNCRVIQVTLETLSTFVDWVPISHLADIPLYALLSKLLELEQLRIPAAICLQNIFERKGKTDEKKSILTFFEQTTLFAAIRGLDEATLLSQQHYPFLKELSKCFLFLGTTLCSVMAMVPCPIEEPQNFPLYLECIIIFTRHPSLVISQNAQSLWLSIFRNPVLSTSATVLNLIPVLLKFEAQKILKVGYPSKSNSVTCEYSATEFDSDEDFERFFNKYRADVGELLRLLMNAQPQAVFTLCKTLLTSLYKGNTWKEILDAGSTDMDLPLCWDAMVTFTEAVGNTLFKKDLTVSKEYAEEAYEMITMCKNLVTKDPVILSYSLSCISALFFFYTFAPEKCSEVLDKIFSYFTAFSKDDTMIKEVKNLRRHGTSLLIKLSCNHPTLLFPFFPKMCKIVDTLFETEEFLTHFDKCAIIEALMTLSNQFHDYEKQSEFLKVALVSPIQILNSPTSLAGIASSEVFISFLGIDKPEQMTNSIFAVSKDVSDLMYAVNIIRACVKRCVCPLDEEVAKKGNFIHPLSETLGTVYYRNPASQYVIPILEQIIQLLKTLNGMYDPIVKRKIDPSFLSVLGISEADKHIILGQSFPDSLQQQKIPKERIKSYIQNMYEGCLYILASSVENLGIDFYTIPNLRALLKGSILFKIEFMPSYNYRHFIRLFLRQFFLRCPPYAYNELILVLKDLCPFMHQKLSAVWEKFKVQYGTSIGYEEQQTETEEVLEDQLNRFLTREYIQFLVDLLHKQTTKVANGESMEDGQPETTQNQSKTLTELGMRIMNTESVRTVFICTAFDSLRWLDTLASLKATTLCELIFHKIIEDNLIQKLQEANYLLQSVLYGLQELGEHESNVHVLMAFSLNVYETLLVRFPNIRYTLMTLVDCDEKSMKTLDNALTKNNLPKPKLDKQKKDAFKNAVSKIVGKNLGQQHKQPVLIKNLPPLISFKLKENSNLFDVEVNEDIGLCKLFTPKSTS